MAINPHELRARIEHSRILANYSKKELCDHLRMSISTLKRKLNNPLLFTLEEYFELVYVLESNFLVEYLVELEDERLSEKKLLKRIARGVEIKKTIN